MNKQTYRSYLKWLSFTTDSPEGDFANDSFRSLVGWKGQTMKSLYKLAQCQMSWEAKIAFARTCVSYCECSGKRLPKFVFEILSESVM